MKSTQAASEMKPIIQNVYFNKFNRKLKFVTKDRTSRSKKISSKPWWIYPAGWKKFTQRLKKPQKILQQQEKLLNKQIIFPTFPLTNIQNKNIDLSPDMEIIKITTIVEAIRQKRQNNGILEAATNIQKIIGKKRSKRSSYESGNNSTVTKNSQQARQGKTSVSDKKSRYPKSDYQQQETLLTGKRNENVTDLKVANSAAIPSTVFYKRIWEYINGTRSHSDIISGYDSLENNSEKDNSTCTDKNRITVSQSQEDKSQITVPNIKPVRDFYKRIWDIINTTQAKINTKARFKRNASISENYTTSTPLCTQKGTVNYKEDKQVQARNEKRSLGTTDVNSPEISTSGPYTSSFWTVANKIQWQPKKTPVENLAKLNYDPILSSLVNSASEVDDLNKFPDKVENVDYSSLDNSTGYTNETSNLSQEIITEPELPYSSEESFATSSFSPHTIESIVDKSSQENDQTKRTENYSTDATPEYNPLNIPYVEVPDYSDQQENSLDKSNQSTTATRYKEYDDSDHNSKRLHDADDFSSKSPSAEIKVVQTESDRPETSLNANSRLSCTKEGKDSAECVHKYDVEDIKLRNNTEDIMYNKDHRLAEDSAEFVLPKENENSDFIDFDEYKKPFNWDEFYKNNPILESIRAVFSKKYNHKENPAEEDRTDKSEEIETYTTDSKEQSHAFDDRDKAKEENNSYEKNEAKESETIDHYPYDYKDFLKHTFGKDIDKESEYNYKENPYSIKESEEVETHVTDSKERNENPEESEEVKTYATDSKELSQDYFVKNKDYHDNHRIASDGTDEASHREEEIDSAAKKEEKKSEKIDEDLYPYDDKDFFKHIFRKDNNKESSDAIDTENEFLSSYFTKNILRELQDNSTAEEDKQKKESKNREDIHKTLSRILDKKDRFSRLDENLNKMIEKGEAIPIKYNNFWSLEYESPRKRNEDNEKQTEDSKEEA